MTAQDVLSAALALIGEGFVGEAAQVLRLIDLLLWEMLPAENARRAVCGDPQREMLEPLGTMNEEIMFDLALLRGVLPWGLAAALLAENLDPRADMMRLRLEDRLDKLTPYVMEVEEE